MGLSPVSYVECGLLSADCRKALGVGESLVWRPWPRAGRPAWWFLYYSGLWPCLGPLAAARARKCEIFKDAGVKGAG